MPFLLLTSRHQLATYYMQIRQNVNISSTVIWYEEPEQTCQTLGCDVFCVILGCVTDTIWYRRFRKLIYQHQRQFFFSFHVSQYLSVLWWRLKRFAYVLVDIFVFFISHSFLSVHHVYDKTELYITELSLHPSSKRPVYTLWGGQRDSALGLGWHHSPFCKMTLFPCLLYVMQSLSAPCYFCGYISVNLPNTQYSLWSSALPPFSRQKGTDFEFDFGPAEVIFANIIAKLDQSKIFSSYY